MAQIPSRVFTNVLGKQAQSPRTWVGVCMEIAVLQQLAQGALDAHVHKINDVQSGRGHGSLVGQLHAVHPLHAQHPPRCVRPDDARRADAGNAAVQVLHNHVSRTIHSASDACPLHQQRSESSSKESLRDRQSLKHSNAGSPKRAQRNGKGVQEDLTVNSFEQAHILEEKDSVRKH